MKLMILLVAVAVSTAQKTSTISPLSLRAMNEIPTEEEKLDRFMRAVSDHCKAGSKRKRSTIEDASEDMVRRLILDIFNDCSEESNPPPAPIDGPCSSPDTVNLTDWWRQDDTGFRHKPVNNFYNCDEELQNNVKWFRITGAAGNRLRDSCVPSYSCGSQGGFWTNAEMPTEVGEIRQVPIYGSWNGICSWYTWPDANPLTVQRCSPRDGDFVYRVQGSQSCYWTFCGME